MDNLQIILIFILFFSVVIHEISHGAVALWQGDDTAEKAGRLTLNPIPHIDIVGTILVPMMFILSGSSAFLAWAKPVPYNPNNLRNKRWGELMVAIAGPASNFILAIFFVILFYIFKNSISEFVLSILFLSGFMNLFLGIFNLIPIVPLDGSKILFDLLPINLSNTVRGFMERNNAYIFIVFILIIFNTNFLSEFTQWIYGFLIS